MAERPVSLRRARRRVSDAVDSVIAGIPAEPGAPFDIADFCARLAELRGRPIELLAMGPLLGGRPVPMTGLLVALPNADYLFYDDSTSPSFRENAIMHELGHLVLGHSAGGSPLDDDVDLMATLLPDLDPGMVRRMLSTALGRRGYTDRQEVEAEMFASLLWRRRGVDGHTLIRPTVRLAPEDERVVDRLAQVLGATDPEDR
ncbi:MULTISPECIES: ImmA/IrrE family metallo-endopeptidase [Actinokineospora]|uniref:IrrE N-terminal-like domain-containing protein n=1 Tax=Actinokineospora fastidiosa TaxID=1816 RepID=A0A918GDN7_9PSEU|nr:MULTISPECIES: ImmA/IrrE family metallo-endopeptidase [Actinokineospora]UVS79895.1 hypothetical protein Actkin_03645 [Actinokineospora sp. UTMC 2448]GGS31599.1 hypothetical protein GCM10010171_26850 [Actinokineospora fastidiosa]